MSVKDVVENDLKIPFSNQCLLFKDTELKVSIIFIILSYVYLGDHTVAITIRDQ